MIEVTRAKMRIASMAVNLQNHGDQEIPVTYLKLEIGLTVDDLALFSSTVRGSWYHSGEAPTLRVQEVHGPYDIEGKMKGAIVTIHRGVDDDQSNIKMVGCDLDNYQLDPKDGGAVTWVCKLACFPGDTQLAHLYRGQRREFEVTIQQAQAEMPLAAKSDDDDDKPKRKRNDKATAGVMDTPPIH